MDGVDDGTVTGRVLAVLEAVADLDDAATLANLARRTGIPKPTVRRIAADLVGRGMLQRGDRAYWLGPRLLELGRRATAQHGLQEAATPYLHDLLARSGEIAWLVAFTDSTSVLLNTAFGRNRADDMRHPWPTDLRGPRFLHSAAGRVLLGDRPDLIDDARRRPATQPTPYSLTRWAQITAAIDGARDKGYAVEREQSMRGYHCIAAGIRDDNRRIVAVVGVLGRTTFAAERLSRPLVTAATGIEKTLTTSPR
jgi:DNA-binding IclR family transcriptional regulator